MEYKTVLLPGAVTKKQAVKIEVALNEIASEGWQLHSFAPQSAMGGTDGNLAVFTREEH
ncbi:DUF4177 domain-containing protein [Alkalicoccobacillus gibsonii]|uniref:DUF4177 domain-containing protein n=1 Tax=Alkalicoccobacillus gibsonii TaxID=79881 RepID=A0ABU9VIB5_9BACI